MLIPSSLASELQKIGLSKEELHEVISDLNYGPGSDGPDSSPPGEDINQDSANLQTLSFLTDHHFHEGSINPELVVSAQVAEASSFFNESLQVFDALSMLGENSDEYMPDDDQIIDSKNGTFEFGDDETSFDQTLEPVLDHIDGVLGGRNISFSTGEYDLSVLDAPRLLIAASDHLALAGDLSFKSGYELSTNLSDDFTSELLLVSAGSIHFALLPALIMMATY